MRQPQANLDDAITETTETTTQTPAEAPAPARVTDYSMPWLAYCLATGKFPEDIAPLVAFLAHEDCPVTGEIYAAGAGRFARIFIASTPGYLHTDGEPTVGHQVGFTPLVKADRLAGALGILDDLAKQEQFFTDVFDSAILYEGEHALLWYIEALNGQRALESVPNLMYRDETGMHQSKEVYTEKTTALPLPDFDGNRVVLGAWVVEDEAAGLGIRESAEQAATPAPAASSPAGPHSHADRNAATAMPAGVSIASQAGPPSPPWPSPPSASPRT